MYSKYDFSPEIRSVQRYWDRQGFEVRKKKNQIRVNPRVIEKRNEYLRKISGNRAKAPRLPLREVCMVESNVHQSCRPDKYNFYHPDDQNQVGRDCH